MRGKLDTFIKDWSSKLWPHKRGDRWGEWPYIGGLLYSIMAPSQV